MDLAASANWLEELDLERAYRRLVNYGDIGNSLFQSPLQTSLLDVASRQSMASHIAPELTVIDRDLINRNVKINGGPIPGMDASRVYGTQSKNSSPTSSAPSSTQKKRGLSDDPKSRNVSPARERRQSPSGAQAKKPRSQSIVHTTFRSAR